MSTPAEIPPSALAGLLISVRARERSGSRSSNRFSYQHAWGLGLVLELHEKPDDYCVLFDIHEDVVALNSSVTPTKADLYQIKTKVGSNWTILALTKREKNKKTGTLKPSHLGNLYHNYLKFPGFVRSMSFVTNAQFSFKMASDPPCADRNRFCFLDIGDDEKNEILSKVASEQGLTSAKDGLTCTYFVKTSLSVQDHERHSYGIVADFLAKNLDETIPPRSFSRTLYSEIRRRNDCEAAASTFAELAKTKGMSRTDFQAMLNSVHTERRMDDLASQVREQLVREGGDIRRQGKINEEVRKYLAKRLNELNVMIGTARKLIEAKIAAMPDSTFASATPIAGAAMAILTNPENELTTVSSLYSDFFLHAMIAVAIYEQLEFPPTTAQPSEEES